MADNTLSILKPSVNNLTTRIFVRAAGLDFDELDVWGKKSTTEFLAKDPADLTPLLEEEGLPKGALWESCAIMQYLCNKHGLDQFYPRDPGERAMVDSAMFYLIGTFYPLVARATYPTLGFPQYPGEVATSDADDAMKEQARQDAEDALAAPLEAFRTFFLDGRRFVGGDAPSIADMRWAATLEFLRAIDYDFPAWAEEYLAAMEESLGDAYTEPAADVRGYVESVRRRPEREPSLQRDPDGVVEVSPRPVATRSNSGPRDGCATVRCRRQPSAPRRRRHRRHSGRRRLSRSVARRTIRRRPARRGAERSRASMRRLRLGLVEEPGVP